MAVRSKRLSSAEAFLTFLNDEMLDRRTAFPAEITKINVSETNGALLSVDVLPLIQQTISSENTDELTYQNLPIISNVPIVYPHDSVSGFSLTVPVKIGSQVLVVIADRSIDNWQETGEPSQPVETTTPRAHDLTDAIAIPGISNDMSIVEDYQFDRISLRSIDNSVHVYVSDNEVEIESNGSRILVRDNIITLSSGTSSITMTDNSITINADTVTITGNQFNMSSDANNATAADIIGNTGISLNTHVHLSNGNNKLTDPPQ